MNETDRGSARDAQLIDALCTCAEIGRDKTLTHNEVAARCDDRQIWLLAGIRADAWDEGHRDVCHDCNCPAAANPYRQDTP